MNIDQRIEALTAAMEMQGNHIAMLLEDAKTRNADIEALIEQSRLAKGERDQDGANIRALALIVKQQSAEIDTLGRIAGLHEERLDAIEGTKEA